MVQDKKKIIPKDVQKIIIDYLNSAIMDKEFEYWLYENVWLENIIKSEYLELITLNFSNKNNCKQVRKILNNFLNYKEYETSEIIKSIDNILSLNDEMPESLKLLYNLSTHSEYLFLNELENSFYSLAFEVGVCYMKDWVKLTKEQRIDIVYLFRDNLFENCNHVKDDIKTGKIVFKPHLSLEGEFYG